MSCNNSILNTGTCVDDNIMTSTLQSFEDRIKKLETINNVGVMTLLNASTVDPNMANATIHMINGELYLKGVDGKRYKFTLTEV